MYCLFARICPLSSSASCSGCAQKASGRAKAGSGGMVREAGKAADSAADPGPDREWGWVAAPVEIANQQQVGDRVAAAPL